MPIQREALAKIAAMDSEGVRADDLGRAAAIARAALSAPTEQAPALPKHETREMHDAVMSVLYAGVARTNTDALWQAYRSALLAAYPSAPTAVQPAAHPGIASYGSIAERAQAGLDAGLWSATPTAVKEAGGVDAKAAISNALNQPGDTALFAIWEFAAHHSPVFNEMVRLQSARAVVSAVLKGFRDWLGTPQASAAQPATPVVQMYRGKCDDGMRCLHGCYGNEPCYYRRNEGGPIAAPVAPKTLEALTAEDIPDLWQNAADVPIVSRSGPPERWYLRGLQDGQRALAAKNNMTLGGGNA